MCQGRASLSGNPVAAPAVILPRAANGRSAAVGANLFTLFAWFCVDVATQRAIASQAKSDSTAAGSNRRSALAVEPDEAFNPTDAGTLRRDAVVF